MPVEIEKASPLIADESRGVDLATISSLGPTKSANSYYSAS